MSIRQISYSEFIDGLPDVTCTAPELNKVCLHKYISLCNVHNVTNVLDRQLYAVGSKGMAVCADWWDDCLELPIYHQTCHPFVPWTFDDFQEAVPDIIEVCKHLDLPFAPESITFKGVQPTEKHTAKLNSRRCILGATTDATLASLNNKRRYKVTKALDGCVWFTDIATESCLPYVKETLRARFEDETEYQYALVQVLWAIACGATQIRLDESSGQGYAFFVVRDFGTQTGGVKQLEAMFQAVVQSSDNAGTKLLGAAISEFSGSINILEPTCKTSFHELSIDIYKRVITNEDHNVSMLFIGCDNHTDGIYPPYNENGIWVE